MKNMIPCRLREKQDVLDSCCCCNCFFQRCGLGHGGLKLTGKLYCVAFLDYPEWKYNGVIEIEKHGICELFSESKPKNKA